MQQKVDYKKLNYINKEWDEDSVQMIKDMLAVYDDGHRIVICHPNNIFTEKTISSQNPDITEIDWENLSENFSYNADNSFVNFMPECGAAFKYVYSRLRHELFNENGNLNSEIRHLVVVQQDGNGGNLVRGLFRATKKDLKIAENPMYTKFKPVSNWDKTIRLFGEEPISLKEYVEANKKTDTTSAKPNGDQSAIVK